MDWFLSDLSLKMVCDQIDGLIPEEHLAQARNDTYISDIVKPTDRESRVLCVAIDMIARKFSIQYGYDIGLVKFAVIYHIIKRHDELLQEREQDRALGVRSAAEEWIFNLAGSRLEGPI